MGNSEETNRCRDGMALEDRKALWVKLATPLPPRFTAMDEEERHPR